MTNNINVLHDEIYDDIYENTSYEFMKNENDIEIIDKKIEKIDLKKFEFKKKYDFIKLLN